jgi:hypothetical protein
MFGHDRLEGRPVPQIERIDGLHVVMAVEQHVRARGAVAVAPAEDGGVSRGRPHLGRKTDGRDVPCEMVRGLPAILHKGRIGRDRLDPQQCEQPLEAVVEIGIDAVEDRRELQRVGHSAVPLLAGFRLRF